MPKKVSHHSPLISAEWCAFTNLPWGCGLINFEPQEEALAKVSGKPSQYDDLQVFIDEQDTMRDSVSGSALPSLEVDITDNNVVRATDRIAEWMEENGRLWMN